MSRGVNEKEEGDKECLGLPKLEAAKGNGTCDVITSTPTSREPPVCYVASRLSGAGVVKTC